MSAKDELAALAARHGVPGLLLRAGLDAVLDEHAHELAEKIRHHIMANQGLANWERHLLYGAAGETFYAQEHLDKFEAALQAEYADLIDPEATE